MDTGRPHESETSALPRNQSSKACTNCARIKCKCIPRAAGTSCERCCRLSKTCVPSAPAKQRGPKRGAASRSARLEEKLDGLVALLQTQQVPYTPSQGGNADIGFELDGGELDYGADSLSTSLVSTPSTDKDYPEGPSPVEADESLTKFREEMITFTPYVYISPAMTSGQVRKNFPFLWLNIMSVASKSAKTRNYLSLQTRRIIIERVVAGGERSLDLLLGILTFVNWVHLFPMDKQFASLASQLAVSLIWDLGLQLPPPEHPAQFPPDVNAASRSQQPLRRDRTVEDKRVVLGAFVITSTLSQTFKSADGFRWSPYLDEYLDNLSHHSTLPQDKVLARQVKMQLIVNQFRYPSWKMNNTDIPNAWVDILQLQLDNIINATNETSSELGSEFGFYHYTTLIIREWIKVKPSTLRNEPDLKRYEVYQRCLVAIKAWIGLFFAMPLRMYATVPWSTYSQLCYVVLFLHQITTTRDADWNPDAAQEVMDPLQTVDTILHIFEQVKAAAVAQDPDSGEDQALTLAIKKFQFLKSAWYGELIPQDKGPTIVQEAEMPSSPTDSLYSVGFHMLPNMLNGILWQ